MLEVKKERNKGKEYVIKELIKLPITNNMIKCEDMTNLIIKIGAEIIKSEEE